MKTILFPTDFSKNAENALDYTLAFAVKMDAKIIILSVCPLPYDFTLHVEEAIQSMEKFYDDKLEKLIHALKNKESYKHLSITGKTSSGSIVFSILEAAKKFDPDLIVMGTKGANGLEKFFFGSNTAEVLRRAKVPVLVIPRDASFKKFRKLIYAIDYRENDLDILKELGELARLLDVDLETAHVAQKDSLQEQIQHRGLIQLLKDELSNIITKHQLIINKSFFDGLEGYLNDNPDSLLVMAHYKKPFLDALLSNSMTEEMAYHSKTPLLIFNQH